MPDNENPEVVLIENEDNEGNEVGEKDENKKPELTPEQIEGIERRQLTKLAKKFGIELPKPESEKKVEKKEEGFDYGQKAYLKASGIKSEDFDYVQEVMKATGKSLDDVLDSKYFQAELKERIDKRNSVEAVPSSTKRSGTSSRDSVDYWLAKDEMPPADQPKLRQEYVNAKIKATTDGNPFTKNSVV